MTSQKYEIRHFNKFTQRDYLDVYEVFFSDAGFVEQVQYTGYENRRRVKAETYVGDTARLIYTDITERTGGNGR